MLLILLLFSFKNKLHKRALLFHVGFQIICKLYVCINLNERSTHNTMHRSHKHIYCNKVSFRSLFSHFKFFFISFHCLLAFVCCLAFFSIYLYVFRCVSTVSTKHIFHNLISEMKHLIARRQIKKKWNGGKKSVLHNTHSPTRLTNVVNVRHLYANFVLIRAACHSIGEYHFPYLDYDINLNAVFFSLVRAMSPE